MISIAFYVFIINIIIPQKTVIFVLELHMSELLNVQTKELARFLVFFSYWFCSIGHGFIRTIYLFEIDA